MGVAHPEMIWTLEMLNFALGALVTRRLTRDAPRWRTVVSRATGCAVVVSPGCAQCVSVCGCVLERFVDRLHGEMDRTSSCVDHGGTADERQTCRSSAIVLAPRPRRQPVISTSCVSVYSVERRKDSPSQWGKGENVLNVGETFPWARHDVEEAALPRPRLRRGVSSCSAR